MSSDYKSPAPRGMYILQALDQHALNGDAFVMSDEIYRICCEGKRQVPYTVFQTDLAELFRAGKLRREGTRIYRTRTLRYEDSAAGKLAAILRDNKLPCQDIPEEMMVGNLILLPEQREAVKQALSCRISVILGGAGSGKTTLIRAIANQYGGEAYRVLAAPTGKAARNLTARTGMVARTVHSALGMHPNDDFLSPVIWGNVGLVIIDEASMMTLEMLVGCLCKMRHDCRLVLLGDPNQLQSVGSGNVLPDLLELGVPYVRLESNHRQAGADIGLQNNVVGFGGHVSIRDLMFDDSFVMEEMGEQDIGKTLVKEAARRYCSGESVQVLSPTNLTVDRLNRAIREVVNPAGSAKQELRCKGMLFRDGDRVMLTQNDRDRDCCNGDVGILHIEDNDSDDPVYHVELPDGRTPKWNDCGGLLNMTLAYAVTVHKSQGSEYDTILMPMTNGLVSMMYRNLIYTAISRAKKQVILYGSLNALGVALQKDARDRRSMLVTKTRMAALRSA